MMLLLAHAIIGVDELVLPRTLRLPHLKSYRSQVDPDLRIASVRIRSSEIWSSFFLFAFIGVFGRF